MVVNNTSTSMTGWFVFYQHIEYRRQSEPYAPTVLQCRHFLWNSVWVEKVKHLDNMWWVFATDFPSFKTYIALTIIVWNRYKCYSWPFYKNVGLLFILSSSGFFHQGNKISWKCDYSMAKSRLWDWKCNKKTFTLNIDNNLLHIWNNCEYAYSSNSMAYFMAECK